MESYLFMGILIAFAAGIMMVIALAVISDLREASRTRNVKMAGRLSMDPVRKERMRAMVVELSSARRVEDVEDLVRSSRTA